MSQTRRRKRPGSRSNVRTRTCHLGLARFPRHVLDGCETALVLFAAGFHARQDATWVADAGLQATRVDTDAKRLGEMVLAYPEGWEYVHGDVFGYAEMRGAPGPSCRSTRQRPCSDAAPASRPVWCELANQAVLLGSGDSPELSTLGRGSQSPVGALGDLAPPGCMACRSKVGVHLPHRVCVLEAPGFASCAGL